MIFAKTEVGQQVLKDRSIPLTPRQRSAFIMFDGKRSLADVLAATQAMGIVAEDVHKLVELGLLEEIASATPAPAPVAVAAPSGAGPATEAAAPAALAGASGRTAQQRYQDAYPIATRLTASLGLRGFRLNLAVEAAASYEQLLELAPKIGAAVGPEQYGPLQRALND
jgi:hypothetical protein